MTLRNMFSVVAVCAPAVVAFNGNDFLMGKLNENYDHPRHHRFGLLSLRDLSWYRARDSFLLHINITIHTAKPELFGRCDAINIAVKKARRKKNFRIVSFVKLESDTSVKVFLSRCYCKSDFFYLFLEPLFVVCIQTHVTFIVSLLIKENYEDQASRLCNVYESRFFFFFSASLVGVRRWNAMW